MKHSSIRQPLGAVKRSLQQGGGILAAFSVAGFQCIDHFPTFKVILYFNGVEAVIIQYGTVGVDLCDRAIFNSQVGEMGQSFMGGTLCDQLCLRLQLILL